MLISVIIPVYNAGKYLARCIESVLGQTHRDLELILVDDGSRDGSGAVCDGYAARDSRVRVIHKANGGVSAARNDGIEAARGEFIAFCDNDDFYAPGMLERLLGMCLDNDCDIAGCRSDRGTAESLPTPPRRSVKIMTGRELLETFYINGTPYIWDKLYRRDVWNGIRFPVGSYMHEDVSIVHRLYGAASRVAVTGERLYYHFRNPESVVGSGFNVRWAQEDPYADRMEYARAEDLPRLLAGTLPRRVHWEGYLLAMNRRYNRDGSSRRVFQAEHRVLFRRYYREAMSDGAVSTKDKLFLFAGRYCPPLVRIYNNIKRCVRSIGAEGK
jgi:glycosyltransferase involved in cell wall biosynthesis